MAKSESANNSSAAYIAIFIGNLLYIGLMVSVLNVVLGLLLTAAVKFEKDQHNMLQFTGTVYSLAFL